MPKGSSKLKDKLEGNKLDLSLCTLTDVPVSEIVAIPKATQLDLSDNQLCQLPGDFCMRLCNITWLDLSQNQLTELPLDFGLMVRLQHLDLYNNKLDTLPISFSELRSLKWLDVKDNPLKPEMAAVTGDCLNDADCRKCASGVVKLMQTVREDELQREELGEKKKQKKEAKKKAQQERDRLKKKEEKKLEKEKRRQEYESKQAEMEKERQEDKEKESQNGNVDVTASKAKKVTKPAEEKGGLTGWGVLFLSFMGFILLMVGLHIHCDVNRKDASCVQGRALLKNYQTILEHYYHHAKDFVADTISPK